ncbi:unnamed protein product [Microthlaspi erraticum]|uniref:Uncharacterized protein n=1 Tax=Microthlaspi erraticum TaxID=1685480 RepID=A0A6D2IVA7_9BRAS|nr:unnamed protein product [Microthlaspi erraticum]
MDRISNQPDEIICHIVSFLSAKDAAFTTVLSKRWHNQFTIIPDLKIENASDKDGERFKTFLDGVLALPASTRVRNFSLNWWDVDESVHYDHINTCLRHVLNHGVLDLALWIGGVQGYSLPFQVFTCKTITKLSLGFGFAIDILPPNAFLPALKTLSLFSVMFREFGGRCAFKTLLGACPLLEELTLRDINWQHWKWSRTVTSLSLKRLTVTRKEWDAFDDSDFTSISFDTPGLAYLHNSDYVPREFLNVNFSSLVEAKLYLCPEENYMWEESDRNRFRPKNLLNGLKDVEILNLYTIQTAKLDSISVWFIGSKPYQSRKEKETSSLDSRVRRLFVATDEQVKKQKKIKMRTKSIPARSRNKSLIPSRSLPGRFGSGEINPDTSDDDYERDDVAHEKRHFRLEKGDETGKSETLEFDACIVCEVSDNLVIRCCGVDCMVHYHDKCLTPEFGGNEDLSNPFCPYCWLKIVSQKCKSLREEAIEAEKAVFKYLEKEKDDVKESVPKSQEEHSRKSRDIASEDQADKDSHKPEEDEGKLQVVTGMKEYNLIDEEVEASEDEERVATEHFQDDEEEDERAQVEARVSTGAGETRDASSDSGEEHDVVQPNDEKQGRSRKRRRVELSDSDSDILLTEERNGEDVTEQEREASAATVAAAKLKTARDLSFFNKDKKRRVLWTPEEEEMLKVGVEKFAAQVNKNMPWRKILEMGENVFNQTRTPSDLKDKWRNMIKALH